MEHVLQKVMSAWSQGLWRRHFCMGISIGVLLRWSPNMSAWSTWECAFGEMSAGSIGTCVSPRFVCMVYRSLCCYQTFLHGLKDPLYSQTCLHGLQKHILLRDMSACYKGACADPIHVCMVIRSICRSETLGAYAARDMSTWSTRACALTSKVCTVYRILWC
jgi:hypothetical protein